MVQDTMFLNHQEKSEMTDSIVDMALVPFRQKDDVMTDVYVPPRDSVYVRWGYFKDVESIIKSGMFYPVFITGLSGNGKTTMVEQACAKLKKNFIRVQISPETDEHDLMGGYVLSQKKLLTIKCNDTMKKHYDNWSKIK